MIQDSGQGRVGSGGQGPPYLWEFCFILYIHDVLMS